MIYYCTTALRHIATRLLHWWLHTLFIHFGQHSALKTHASYTCGGDESFGREETPLLLVTQPAGLAAWLREGGQNPANIAHKHLGTCGQHGSARPHTGWGPTQSWPAGFAQVRKADEILFLGDIAFCWDQLPGRPKASLKGLSKVLFFSKHSLSKRRVCVMESLPYSITHDNTWSMIKTRLGENTSGHAAN